MFGRFDQAINFSVEKALSNCTQALGKSFSDAAIESVVPQVVCEAFTESYLRQDSMV